MIFDPLYLLFLAPAILLGLWAQARVKSAFAEASRVRARMTGAQAARMVLDSAGLNNVAIEPIQGHLTDHYDPRHKVLRLSPQVYQNASMAAVGVAAHEAGHALQDAKHYAPLVIRNLAVPAASFGGGISWVLIIIGAFMSGGASAASGMGSFFIWAGIAAFSCVVFFQVINLPVEFDASRRAKVQLVELGVIDAQGQAYVSRVLDAAAWTYVAGTLQAIMTLLYFLVRFGGRR